MIKSHYIFEKIYIFILSLVLKYRLHITFLFAISLYLISQKNTSISNLVAILCFSLCHSAFHLYNRALDRDGDIISNPKEALKDVTEIPILKNLSYLMAALAILIMVLFNKAIVLIFLSAGMAFLYNNFLGINIKKIFFFKNLYMALFYSLPFCFYSYSVIDYPLKLQIVFSFFNYAFTILAIEALWDIKDIEGDKSLGVITIANRFGVKNTKIYAFCLMLIAWIFQIYLYKNVVYFSTFLILYYLFFLRINCSIWHYHGPLLIILFLSIIMFYF